MALRQSIARNTAFDSATQAGSMAFSIFAGIFLARMLGDEGRGQYVFATSFAGMLVLGFTNLGVELSASMMVAKRPDRVAPIHTLIVLISLAAGMVLWLAALGAGTFITQKLLPGLDPFSLYLVATAVPFWIYQFGCYGILVGLEKVRTRAIYDLAFSLTQNLMVLLILFLPLWRGESAAVDLLIFSFYAVIIVFCFFLGRSLGRGRRLWSWPRGRLVREFLRFGFWVYAGNLGTNLGQRIDQYFVQQVSGGAAAFGVYTLATGLTHRTRVFPQALARSTYARICSAAPREAALLVAACFRQMLALGFLLIAAGTLLSPLIPLIYTREFAGAVAPFIIFLFGRLFHNCSWMLANYFTGHLARPEIPMMVNWGLLPAQGVAAYFAMKWGGLVAVALITSASYAMMFLVFLILFLRWQRDAGWRELFLLGGADVKPWLALLPHRRKR